MAAGRMAAVTAISEKSVIVIGGGITGVACALTLRREGWAVTLVDPRDPGDPGQTSFGNAGILARSAVVPVPVPGLIWRAPRLLLDPGQPLFLRLGYLPRLLPWLVSFLRNGARARLEAIVPALHALTHDTVEQHRALAAGTAAEALLAGHEYGYLFRDRAAFEGSRLAFGLKAAQGYDWDERDARRLRRDDPALGPAYGFGAVFRDHGWVTDPGAYVAALAAALEAAGGRVLRATARDIRSRKAGADVVTDAGTLTGARVVLAAGAWSRRLAERLGLATPLESERGYHLMLRAPSVRPPFPYMLADKALAVTPMRGGLRLAGLAEFGGLDAPPSAAPVRLIRAALPRLYPGLAWEGESVWMGHRPTMADSLPMLGPVPGMPAVICAFGSQHLGLTIGPRLGRTVADMVADRRANLDLRPYAPERFGRARS